MSNSNINLQTQSSNALHNAIMEAGSKDRPPMLAPGNYVQWKSRIKRYIDTKPNSELIHYCLQNLPYTYQWPKKTVRVAEGNSETTIEMYMENYKNVSQDIHDQLNAEAKAVQIILTGIDNDIYSTVDACPNACEMWKAIKWLKQGESINVQDLETNLFWEFGKFTSRDGKSLESYYSRFYKMMNELVRNQCHVINHQVNVEFLLQLQPEWQRFVTLVKKSQELKTVSYHKLYDILKQHQNEVNEIRAERLARTANPLALVAQQQPVYHPQNHPTQNTQYSSTRSQQSTRNRGKAIVTSSAPTYDPEPTTVTEDDEMSKEKKIDKLMALISLSFKKIYKPTNNNLRTSSNISRANQDNSPRINRGTGHVSRECQKMKRVKDAAYHKEKMLLCKQEEVGVQLNAEQADWKDDIDDESEDQELEAHYMYMAQIQEVTPDPVDNSGPIFDDEPMHKLGNDLLTGSRGTNLYSITLQDSTTPNPICLMAKATSSQAWFLKKFQATCCYNDNLALMLAPDSDETIRLEKEHRSKLNDLIRPFDYDQLNNLYDLNLGKLIPQENVLFNKVEAMSIVFEAHQQPTKRLIIEQLVEIILFIVDSGCSKHMTGNLKLLTNFVEKFLGTVKFGNDQIAPILGYRDLVQGTITIKRVYYVEGLNHNLFSVGQFCDADLEVAFRSLHVISGDLKE
ncbi:hypothetical protein Tco_0796577 [Tanacetum coccineum]